MPLFVFIDLVLGAATIAGSVWLRFDAGRHSLPHPDDQVVRADLAAALRSWGAAVFLLGLLALGQFPGGFTLSIWSVLAVGLGAIGAVIAVLRWRVEGWELRSSTPKSDLLRVESETWEFALIGWVAALSGTYVLGVLLNIMQPVHLGISLLGSAVGYAVGLIIWTPRAKVHRVAPSEPADPIRHVVPYRRSQRRRPHRPRPRQGADDQAARD
ncbi:MAG: hypothetical protein M3067_09970 [Chloroflexota bacterium]|nr:hypothetical protein [Chloroflexota bacterium]